MKAISIIIGVTVLILGVGYFATNVNNGPVLAPLAETATTAETSLVAGTISDEELAPEVTITADTAPGVYTAYDANAIAQSDAEHILLFFKASWCPSCRALDADIIANLQKIPAGVEIYTVDYDTATNLKRQYGVTTQHSIIEITAGGTAQSGITHGLTLDDVLDTI